MTVIVIFSLSDGKDIVEELCGFWLQCVGGGLVGLGCWYISSSYMGIDYVNPQSVV